MIRVVVTGSECTGKTTLAADLAASYHLPWVPEYSRRFVAEEGRAAGRHDVDAIARGQLALEDEALTQGHSLVIQDTDLLSTVVYSRHYYGDCPAWIDATLARRPPDLYLLAGIDVPWEPDGVQRDRPQRRQEMQEIFRQALVARELPHVSINGPRQQRLGLAIESIEGLDPRR